MGVRHHRELEVWQLGNKLRAFLFAVSKREGARQDEEFCSQTRRASNSVCRNIAEGFWRYGHAEFAHFVNIAKGSLGELYDSADEALIRGYIDDKEYAQLNEQIDHAIKATTALYSHLANTPTPRSRPVGPRETGQRKP